MGLYTTRVFVYPRCLCFIQCKVPVGTPSSQHYDTNCDPSERPPGYPYWQVAVPSGNRFEYGGDGGTPEIGLAALDHFYYSQDPSVLDDHLPLATLAATVRIARVGETYVGPGTIAPPHVVLRQALPPQCVPGWAARDLSYRCSRILLLPGASHVSVAYGCFAPKCSLDWLAAVGPRISQWYTVILLRK